MRNESPAVEPVEDIPVVDESPAVEPVGDFPLLVYFSPGKHEAGRGKTYDYEVVTTSEELKAALSEGWAQTVPEAFELADKRGA